MSTPDNMPNDSYDKKDSCTQASKPMENSTILTSETLDKWKKERDLLIENMVLCDTEIWQKTQVLPNRVAGVDISFRKEDSSACAALVVCNLPHLDVVYTDFEEIEMTVPYVPGYLAWREVPPILALINRVSEEFHPDVILVDGNGILHPNKFGCACHIGVLTDIPTIGVAKAIFHLDLSSSAEQRFRFDKSEAKHSLQQPGDFSYVYSPDGEVVGAAVKSSVKCKNPIYVSQGHKISLETAIWIVKRCSLFRVPEPIRQADIMSREYLRKKYQTDCLLTSDSGSDGNAVDVAGNSEQVGKL